MYANYFEVFEQLTLVIFNFKLFVDYMKLLTNSKDWSESRVIISLPPYLSFIGRFPSVSQGV
jgi:hypothetical protein